MTRDAIPEPALSGPSGEAEPTGFLRTRFGRRALLRTGTLGVVGAGVAHVTDATAGDVSIYVGERDVTLRDPTLVQHLLRAAR